MNRPQLQIVVGGQFGSEAKGHVAAQLAARLDSPLVIRTGGPNAGHTVVGPDGRTHKLRQLPTAVVSNPGATIAISAGSLIDPTVLEREMAEQELDYAYCERLIIDPAATVISDRHKRAEALDQNLSGWSTQKGIGAARADRVMRQADTVQRYYGNRADPWFSQMSVSNIARNHLGNGQSVLIEASQGYGLRVPTKFYPKTTSPDWTRWSGSWSGPIRSEWPAIQAHWPAKPPGLNWGWSRNTPRSPTRSGGSGTGTPVWWRRRSGPTAVRRPTSWSR